jgi:hypothetical protein
MDIKEVVVEKNTSNQKKLYQDYNKKKQFK